MNIPRLNPVVFSVGTKVIVAGGTTSNINNDTGCRNTHEVNITSGVFFSYFYLQVFDREDPSAWWMVEDIEENTGCIRSSQRGWTLTIACH